jgi:integrase
MQFDAREAKLLTAGQHFTISDCPGLRLQATATRRSWIYRYKSLVDGRMRQVKLGDWPAMSPAVANVEWEKARQQRDAGVDLSMVSKAAKAVERNARELEREKQRKGVLTVARLCDEYLVGRVEASRAEKGAAEVRRMFATMLGPLGEVEAATLTRSQAFDLISSFLHIPVQAMKLRAEMGAAWDYGLDAGRLPESAANWWRLILRGQIKSKGRYIQGKLAGTKKRVLSEAELAMLIPWLPNFSRLVEEVCTLYLWTCLRGAEILQMEKHELTDEVDGLWWTVPKEKTKNHWRENSGDLRVPLIGRAEVIVRRRMLAAEGSFLFPSNGKTGYVQQKTIGCAIWVHMPYSQTRPESSRARLPVTHWAPHDLRRSGRTLLAALGCPDEVAEAVIGHMPSGIRGVYNRHSYDKERRHWLTRLSDHLEQLVAGAG